jgi:hypothetical protein
MNKFDLIASIYNNLPDNLHTPRGIIELLAIYKLLLSQKMRFDEAIDYLTRELDLDSMLFQGKDLLPIEEVLIQNQLGKINVDDTKQLLHDVYKFQRFDPQSRGVFSPPEWFIDALVSLTMQEQPVLFINAGSSSLIPQYIIKYKNRFNQEVEFMAIEQDKDSVETLRLMVSLVEDDLNNISSEITSFPEYLLENQDRQLIFIYDDPTEKFNNLVGTCYIDLFSQPFSKNLFRERSIQSLADFLVEKISPTGRIIIYGPGTILDGSRWSNFRKELSDIFQVESIVDFSFVDQRFSGLRLGGWCNIGGLQDNAWTGCRPAPVWLQDLHPVIP